LRIRAGGRQTILVKGRPTSRSHRCPTAGRAAAFARRVAREEERAIEAEAETLEEPSLGPLWGRAGREPTATRSLRSPSHCLRAEPGGGAGRPLGTAGARRGGL